MDLKELYDKHSGNMVEAYAEISDTAGYSYATFRRQLIAKGIHDVHKRPVSGYTEPSQLENKVTKSGRMFVVTSAQNNTSVHNGFFDVLQVYCKENNAELIVIPYTYNKNGFQNATKDKDDVWWDSKLTPYICNTRVELDNGIVICGELDILPTAVNPLSGLDSYTGEHTCVIPHPKVRMHTVPTLRTAKQKFMYTTGAITLRNYIQRKAGQKAEFHHCFSALVIDTTMQPHVRQLHYDEKTESICDGRTKYTQSSVSYGERVDSIVLGDVHIEQCKEVDIAHMYNCIRQYMPHKVFLHDLIDFSSRNHHNAKSTWHKYKFKNVLISDELDKAVTLLIDMVRAFDIDVYVVHSNHHDALVNYINTVRIEDDILNADSMLKWKRMLFNNPMEHLFPLIMRDILVSREIPKAVHDKIHFLKEDSNMSVHNIVHSIHGHRGPNGVKGSPQVFAKLGFKCNTGHTHSASIVDGVYTAGVSAPLDLGYNRGPSSWSHSHILTYNNGKRSVITYE